MNEFLKGGKLALPIVAGYIPLGFACGVICAGVGMSVLESVLMSVFVFAGAGQYIAAGMIGSGAGASSIIVTVGIVNMRHLLYNSALYPYLSGWSGFKKALFASEITDETFGLHSAVFGANKDSLSEKTAFGINVFSHLGWVVGNFLGALSGELLGDSKAFGFDFALPALFIALLIPKLTHKPQIFAAVTAGIVAIVCSVNGLPYWGIIVASVFGATAGMIYARRHHA